MYRTRWLLIGAVGLFVSPVLGQLPPQWTPVEPTSSRDVLSCANFSQDHWALAVRPDGSGIEVSQAVSAGPLRLELQDGVLVGYDSGEFGGHVRWVTDDGTADSLFAANPIAILPHSRGPVVVEGLAHLRFDYGRAVRLTREADGWSTSTIAALMGAPRAVTRLSTDTIAVVTTRSLDVLDLASGRRWTAYGNPDWGGFYSSSIVRFEDSFFIGGRHFIVQVALESPWRREVWWQLGACVPRGDGSPDG